MSFDRCGVWSYNLEDNRIDEDKDEQGNQFEDSKTGTAMFKLRPIKRGKYYIYAVANMGDLTQYKDKITTREGLKAISNYQQSCENSIAINVSIVHESLNTFFIAIR